MKSDLGSRAWRVVVATAILAVSAAVHPPAAGAADEPGATFSPGRRILDNLSLDWIIPADVPITMAAACGSGTWDRATVRVSALTRDDTAVGGVREIVFFSTSVSLVEADAGAFEQVFTLPNIPFTQAQFRPSFACFAPGSTTAGVTRTYKVIVPFVPSEPTIGSATAGYQQATVSWTAPPSDDLAPITGYVVTPYIGYYPLPPTTFSSTATTQTVTGLTNGTQYRFRVQAINAAGTGAYSRVTNPVVPAVTVPGPPTIIRNAISGNQDATVTWTAPASDGGSAITGYVVTPYIGYFPLAPRAFASTATTQTVTGLTNGVQYRFTVAATSAIGTGPSSQVSNPVVPGSALVAAGGGHSCATVTGGAVECWGHNLDGQLGNGTTTGSSVPIPVSGITGATAVTAGDRHTCALVAGGTVSCWGRNAFGQLGNGTTISSSTPVQVTGITGATAITAGGDAFSSHTCAIVNGGAVHCWGDNFYGQLGNGTTTGSLVPAPVTGISGAIAIAAGQDHVCAVTTGGAVYCWGSNIYGELGNGTNVGSSLPVAVSGVAGATAIGAGNGHTCAVVAGGAVKCWGNNALGQLGNGTTVSSSSPVPVTGVTGATAISAGSYDTCARTSSGTTKCWGNNASGQLGNGTTASSTVPVQVTGITGASAIASGGGYPSSDHGCAMVSSAVHCWGGNFYGQLGDGTTTDSSVPVPVTGL